MASRSERHAGLTNHQYVRLGQVVSCTSIEYIALGYMGIDKEKIKNLKATRRDDPEGFVRDVIKEWACRNPDDQVQELARVLLTAAREGYVDSRKVKEILGLSLPSPANTSQETECVTEEELLDIADAIRPHTEQAMKIEVAPWIRDYVVNMDELYTELALEKMALENKPTDQDINFLKDYKDLIVGCEPDQSVGGINVHGQKSLPPKKFLRGHKILVKADPGMGKTTLCKKISWDWAKQLFTYFRIVFLVFLKLVKPGDIIENAIIRQNPYIEGLKITEQKLGSILKSFGTQCLLILDGLDEHAYGTNEDVLSIIRGLKHLECNLIVTSRPHSPREIENYFSTIVRIEGFTRNMAKQFAYRILNDRQKVSAVLNFNPTDRDDVPIYKCPILLSFLCLLVRENDIDLSTNEMHIGEIYTRMILCLYKKFTIRKMRNFDIHEFTHSVAQIGKLALKTLLSNNFLLRRSDVIEEVGPDAFDYGLLIGHEDAHILLRDVTADIFVTFPHRTVLEFLAALCFVLMLNEGRQVEEVLGADTPIFMINPLFLRFCLWFLCERQRRYFDLQRGQEVYKRLRDFCVEKVNKIDLNTEDIWKRSPALDVKSACDRNDTLLLQLLNEIIAKCDRTSRLIVNHRDPLHWILNSMTPILKGITCFQCVDKFYPYETHAENSEICISHFQDQGIIMKVIGANFSFLKLILERCGKLVDSPSVSFYLDRTDILFSMSLVNLKRLHVKCNADNESGIGSYPNLTHLCFQASSQQTVFHKGIIRLCEGIKFGQLPCLSHVSIVGFTKIFPKPLFECTWPQLCHLNLLNTKLDADDLEALCFACNGHRKMSVLTFWVIGQKTLPNLTSLLMSISPGITRNVLSSKFFGLPWTNLKRFHINYCLSTPDIHASVCQAIEDDKLSKLTSLEIEMHGGQVCELYCIEKLYNLKSLILCGSLLHAHWQLPTNVLSRLSELAIFSCRNLAGRTSTLLYRPLPLLETLTLRGCGLTSSDLSSLAQANVEGLLPKLRHLDISKNKMLLPEFTCLFHGSSHWHQLLSLDIRNTCKSGPNSEEEGEFSNYLNTVVHGSLLSLQHLGINWYQNRDTVWPRLGRLSLLYCEEDSLRNIGDAVRSGFLPSLHTVCIVHYNGYDARVTRTLSEMNVSCHEFCAAWDDPLGKCHCQEK